MAELRQDVNTQHGLVGSPAPLRVLHKGQVGIANEFAQRRDRPQLLALLLRVIAENGPGQHRFRLAASLRNRQHARRADLELALTPALVAIALIERFAAGGSDFEEESGEGGVEIIDAPSTGRANATPDQR